MDRNADPAIVLRNPRKSYRQVVAHANRTASMPILYRLA